MEGKKKGVRDINKIRAAKRKAIMRLRSLIRLVIENADWLGAADTKIGTNVWKNIAMLVRKKTAARDESLLTLSQKSILKKQANKRSELEKADLNRMIGGIKCFRKYEDNVKKGLAGCTYYMYCKAGRNVVKENHIAKALYVVLSGDIVVTQRQYDAFDNVYYEEEISKLSAEDTFGEVSLLYDIETTASFRTDSNCELLYVLKVDFDTILKASVEKSWNRVRHAMSQFSYFADCDEMAIRECCIYSKVREYQPNKTIYGSGKGGQNDVFFVLSGSCKLVEFIKMEVCENPVKTYYTRLDSPDFNKLPKKETFIHEVKVISKYRPTVNTFHKHGSAISKSQSFRLDDKRLRNNGRAIGNPVICEGKLSIEGSFMEIGIMRRGYCFGLGEKMHNRSVISLTPMVCLLVPRYWLNNHHPEIWGRIKHFLNSYIPSNNVVFRKFQENRRWMSYRKDLIADLLKKKKIINSTSITDVPFTIRFVSDIEEYKMWRN